MWNRAQRIELHVIRGTEVKTKTQVFKKDSWHCSRPIYSLHPSAIWNLLLLYARHQYFSYTNKQRTVKKTQVLPTDNGRLILCEVLMSWLLSAWYHLVRLTLPRLFLPKVAHLALTNFYSRPLGLSDHWIPDYCIYTAFQIIQLLVIKGL